MIRIYSYFKSYAFAGLVIILMSLATLAAVEKDKPNKPNCTAVIEWSVEDKLDVFQAIIRNHTDMVIEGHYIFDAVRTGSHGKSVSRQKGEFKATPEEEVFLSRTAVNIEDSDTYNIILQIFSGELMLCADTISTNLNR